MLQHEVIGPIPSCIFAMGGLMVQRMFKFARKHLTICGKLCSVTYSLGIPEIELLKKEPRQYSRYGVEKKESYYCSGSLS